MDDSHASHALPKSSDGFVETEIIQENDQSLSIDEMRLRVSELEKECSSMREEIKKLGRSNSAWNFFGKLGFGTRWRPHSGVKQFPMHRYC